MGKIMILNASPRAPKSNSKQYAQIFSDNCKAHTDCFNITRTNHDELCSKMSDYTDVLLVFPLYADSIPVTLLNFLKSLENNQPENKPVISVLINCGFIEHYQNNIAVKTVELFCRQNGYKFGSVLKIGSGEAILTTPFKVFAVRKIKKLAASIAKSKYTSLSVTMPISKKMFISASTSYWIKYGEKNGVTKEMMQTMQIEDGAEL